MKKILIMMSLVFFSSSIAKAETCAEKIASIETQISAAKQFGNSNRVEGLETALAKAKSNCTEEKLQEKRDEKIADRKADVAKAQKKLEKAISEGKSDKKIEKKRKKLEEQQKDLQEVLGK